MFILARLRLHANIHIHRPSSVGLFYGLCAYTEDSFQTQKSCCIYRHLFKSFFLVWMSLLTNQQRVCATFDVELPDPILLKNTRTHTHKHTHVHTRTHTYKNTRTYAHTYTHTCTHINTHQQRVRANFDIKLPHPILLRFQHAWCRHDNTFS